MWEMLFGIHVYHGYILQIFIAELMFFGLLMRRKNFVLRLVLSFAVFALLSVVVTNLLTRYATSGFNSLAIFLFSLGMGMVCFSSAYQEILFCFAAAQLIQNLSHNIENLIYLPLSDGIGYVGQFFLSVGVMIIVYGASYYAIIRRLGGGKKISLKSYGVLLIAITSALFCYLIQFLMQIYGIDKLWVTRLPLIFCDVIALALQFGLQGYKWKVDENAELERFIAQEDKYYQSIKDNIDIINMKAHDLKHFIADLRGGKYADDSGLAEIQEAVERYEQTANTGNKALDAVLTQKIYQCHKEGIALSVMAQGEALGFMRMSDISSVFGNILANAIEYEQTVPQVEKRCIVLKVLKDKGLVCIHCENHCTQFPQFEDGLPKTTKGSESYHGFGLKSVRYIVRKYGGNLTVTAEGELFSVDIIMPCPQNSKKSDEL